MSTLTPISIKVKYYVIKNNDNEKVLGVTVDANLNFNCHIQNMLKKANKKVRVLARIRPYMSIPKRKLLMNSFFTSYFNYCPLTWMCHSRAMNNKINRLQERCLHIMYSDKTSFFEKLLENDGSVTIQTRNLRTLATEMFKVYKNLSPAIIADFFHVRQNNRNLRNGSYFAIPNVKSAYHETESLSILGPRIWNLVPNKLKQLVNIHAFKKNLKSGSQKAGHVGSVKLIYQMSVLFKFLSFYLFLKHLQEQSTRNSLMRGLFFLASNQFTEERSGMVFL